MPRKPPYYYQLLDFKAHVWIAHQRYPTRGRVWHPGGAHPFAALNTALVHNGDFANYFSVSEYLSQRHFYPQFLTDTEVAVLTFDLWHRLYGYPLEYVIESMAPTTERDFDLLPPERQRDLPAAPDHQHPRLARTVPGSSSSPGTTRERNSFELIGITDTSMLRPQVFALHDGEVQIGLVCSEKQAIDATLASLAAEDPRFCPVADLYWNARGGSATDGGSFTFSLESQERRPGPLLPRQVRQAQDRALAPAPLGRHHAGDQPRSGFRELSRLIKCQPGRTPSGQKLFQCDPGASRPPSGPMPPSGKSLVVDQRPRPRERRPQGRGHQRPDPAAGPALRPGRQEAQPPAAPASWRP